MNSRVSMPGFSLMSTSITSPLVELRGVTFGYGDMQELVHNPATKPDWLIGSLPEIYENLRPQKTPDNE